MDAILIRNRRPATRWERFITSPLPFLAEELYKLRASDHTIFGLRSRPGNHCGLRVRVVCISDTHNTHSDQPPLPAGDILIHAGDLTVRGTRQELDNVSSWLDRQPHPHKFFIAGNHDTCLADADVATYISATYPNLTYLQESSAEITITRSNSGSSDSEGRAPTSRTLRVYGSPYTPKYGSWEFQYPGVSPRTYAPEENEYQFTEIWRRIPEAVDILVTHYGPPYTHLDLDTKLGCYALLSALWTLVRKPKLHVFGHMHAGRGVEIVRWDSAQRAYEDVCSGRAGWVGLLRLAWYTVVGVLSEGWSREGSSGSTIMVNASSVGGLKNNPLKGAIVVEV